MIAEITTTPTALTEAAERKVRVTFYSPTIGLAQGTGDKLLDTHGTVVPQAEVDQTVAAMRAACETLGISVRA